MSTLEDLQQAADEMRSLEELTRAAMQRRDALVLQLHGQGITGRKLSNAADITEGRLYQILRAGPEALDGSFNGSPARFITDTDGRALIAFVLDEYEEGFDIREEVL